MRDTDRSALAAKLTAVDKAALTARLARAASFIDTDGYSVAVVMLRDVIATLQPLADAATAAHYAAMYPTKEPTDA